MRAPGLSIGRPRTVQTGTATTGGAVTSMHLPAPRPQRRHRKTPPARYNQHPPAAARDPVPVTHGRATQWLMISIEKKYGRSIAEWQQIITGCGLDRHMAIVGYLKSEHGMGHGHANALVGWTLAGNVASALTLREDLMPSPWGQVIPTAGDAYLVVRACLLPARLLAVSGRMPGHIPAGRELVL